MKTDLFRIIGWAIPGACMALSVATVLYQQSALKEAERTRTQVQLDVQSNGVLLADLETVSPGGVYAAAPSSLGEESQFLNDLKSRAQNNGLSIERLASVSAVYGGTGGAIPLAAEDGGVADPAIVQGIKRVSSNVTLTGPYSGLRRFLEGLLRSDRLFSIDSVRWNRGTSDSTLSFNVSRYIDPSLPATPSRPAPVEATESTPAPDEAGEQP